MLTTTELECLTPTGRRMAQLIEEQKRSGLGVGAFALSRGIDPARFFWWRGEIRRRIERHLQAPPRPAFAEAVVVDRDPFPVGPGSHFIVEVGGDRRIEVPPNFDERVLRRLIGVLTSC